MKLILRLLAASLVTALVAQAAYAGPPPRRGSGPPAARGAKTVKHPGQQTNKRVCIDLGVSRQPIVQMTPPAGWPYGIKPDGKTIYTIMQAVVTNKSTTDLDEPYTVHFEVFQPTKGGWQTFLTVNQRRGLKAGRSERVEGRRYYVIGPWPENAPVRVRLPGTHGDRNDCDGRNDISGGKSVDFRSMAQRAATLR